MVLLMMRGSRLLFFNCMTCYKIGMAFHGGDFNLIRSQNDKSNGVVDLR
jgi:hypothetical protein